MNTALLQRLVAPPAGATSEPTALPTIESFPELSLASVVELLLKDRDNIDQLLRDEDYQRELAPRFLTIATAGFAVYGVIATALFNLLRDRTGYWFPHLPAADWHNLTGFNLTLGYTLGLLVAHGICLPSFYFYGLLAGIKISMLGVTAHALKSMAAGAIALVGLLPVYVAFALSAIVFPLGQLWHETFVAAGLLLPFVAGVFGAATLYRGFVSLADTMGPHHAGQRACFLRRLVLAWVACAGFVTPVVIYALWDHLSDLTAAAPLIGG